MDNSAAIGLRRLISAFCGPRKGEAGVLTSRLGFPDSVCTLRDRMGLGNCSPSRRLIRMGDTSNRVLGRRSVITRVASRVTLVILPNILCQDNRILSVRCLATRTRGHKVRVNFSLYRSIKSIPRSLDS